MHYTEFTLIAILLLPSHTLPSDLFTSWHPLAWLSHCALHQAWPAPTVSAAWVPPKSRRLGWSTPAASTAAVEPPPPSPRPLPSSATIPRSPGCRISSAGWRMQISVCRFESICIKFKGVFLFLDLTRLTLACYYFYISAFIYFKIGVLLFYGFSHGHFFVPILIVHILLVLFLLQTVFIHAL